MEKREAKIIFAKAGNGIGAKLTMPIPWLRAMGITPENREIEIVFNEETKQIIIQQKG